MDYARMARFKDERRYRSKVRMSSICIGCRKKLQPRARVKLRSRAVDESSTLVISGELQ